MFSRTTLNDFSSYFIQSDFLKGIFKEEHYLRNCNNICCNYTGTCEAVCFLQTQISSSLPYASRNNACNDVWMPRANREGNDALSRTPTSLFGVKGHSPAFHCMKDLVISLKNKGKAYIL